MPKGILFQGGSIADCARDRKDFYNGYANMVKDSLGTDCLGEYEFINRGVSGDRSVGIYARIKIDFTNPPAFLWAATVTDTSSSSKTAWTR